MKFLATTTVFFGAALAAPNFFRPYLPPPPVIVPGTGLGNLPGQPGNGNGNPPILPVNPPTLPVDPPIQPVNGNDNEYGNGNENIPSQPIDGNGNDNVLPPPVSGGSGGADLCTGLLNSQVQCCATDVLGVADLDCNVPTTLPKSADEFQSICAATGKRPRCCALPVLGQALVCNDPVGTK
ncbi:fungal hydrophobin domain-containing protein [Trichoderma chlorosporum]